MRKLAGTLAICLVAAGFASAQTAAFTMSGIVNDNNNNTWCLGWSFTTNAAVSVTALGWYDTNQDGLNERHSVGIFDDTTQLLVAGASTVVSTADPLTAQFRYHAVTAVLIPNHSYELVGTTGDTFTDTYTWDPQTINFNPLITFGQDRYDVSTTLIYATSTTGTTVGWFGPNMKIAAVPEPATFAALGLGALVLIRRRRK